MKEIIKAFSGLGAYISLHTRLACNTFSNLDIAVDFKPLEVPVLVARVVRNWKDLLTFGRGSSFYPFGSFLEGNISMISTRSHFIF